MKLTKQHQGYVSEYGQFLNKLKAANPSIEEGQREGRAIHWDKQPATLSDQARDKASRVKQLPYVYQSKS